MKLKANADQSHVSLPDGKMYAVDEDGFVDVPGQYAEVLKAHGFTEPSDSDLEDVEVEEEVEEDGKKVVKKVAKKVTKKRK